MSWSFPIRPPPRVRPNPPIRPRLRRARRRRRRLEAELIAIDGFYKVADELEPYLQKKAVQAWLDGGSVKIMTLD